MMKYMVTLFLDNMLVSIGQEKLQEKTLSISQKLIEVFFLLMYITQIPRKQCLQNFHYATQSTQMNH